MCLTFTIVSLLVDVGQQLQPGCVCYAEIQESLHYVKLADGFAVIDQILADFLSSLLRTLFGSLGLRPSLLTLSRVQASLALHSLISSLHERKDHQRQVTFKLAARLLQLQHLFACLHAVERLHGLASGLTYQCLNIHIFGILGAKVRNKLKIEN